MQSSDVVYLHSSEGVITYTNDNIEKSVGFTKDEIIGKHFTEFIHPQDIAKAVDIFERSRKNDPTEKFCLRLRHKDGRFLHFDFKGHAIFKDGIFMGSIGAGQDITAKLIKEEAFGESAELYKVVVDNARDVIYTVSPEGIVTSVNDFMKSVTGFSAEEVIGKQYLYFVHPDEIEYGVRIHEAIMKGEKPPVFEMRFLKKSGDYLQAEFSTTPLFYNGRFLGTLGIGRDISEKKKTEENLKNALLKEKHLNELKQHFISMVSHEFKTPLFIISGTAELLEKECRNTANDKSRKGFKTIKENIKRISNILNDIRLLCDEKNDIIFNPSPLNVIDLCAEIIKDVVSEFTLDNTINFSHCDEISSHSKFSLDAEIMRHILINLLNNAVKYSNESKEPVELRVESVEKGLNFIISDHGIGIPENDLKKLFQNFMRSSNVGKIPGTGIGLAIVKKFVDIHKGEIFIESVLNKGTKVSFLIPR
jgi:PAS domain S-box-containing protein